METILKGLPAAIGASGKAAFLGMLAALNLNFQAGGRGTSE
jgi:hypothetical protein